MATATVSAEPEATSEMCAYCFDTLRHHFMETSSQSASSPAAPVQRFDEAFCPLFVTWNIHPRGFETTTSGNGTNGASLKKEGRLRGCIGTLSSTSISTGLGEYALISSLRDRRFNPIGTEELPRLSVTVSLLTHYEDAKDVYDWQVGVHGIILNFRDPETRSPRNATYLPDVARQEGWTVQEAIASLYRKAGYNGSISEKLLAASSVTRYQASVESMSYPAYCAFRHI